MGQSWSRVGRREQHTSRAAQALTFILLGSCGAPTVVDVEGLADGRYMLTVVSDDRVLLDGEEVEIQDGRLGRALVLEASGEVWALRSRALVNERGVLTRVALEARPPPDAPEYSLDGTLLREALPGEPRQFEAQRFEDGGWGPVPEDRLFPTLSSATMVRTLETESCPPPYGPLRPYVPTSPYIFDGLENWSHAHHMAGLYEVSPGVLLVVGASGAMVLRNGQRPPLDGTGAIDYLPAEAFEPPALFFDEATRAEDGTFLLSGRKRGSGYVWRMTVDEHGIHSAPGSEVGIRPRAIEVHGGRVWIGEEDGAVQSAPGPDGPWTLEVPGEAGRSSTAQFDSGPRGLAHVRSGFLAVLGEMPWPRQPYFPPSSGRHSIEVARWSPDGDLWIGLEAGDLGILSGPTPGADRWLQRVPARAQACNSDGLNYGNLLLLDEIQDIAFDGDLTLAAFEYCSAIWVVRRSDLCGSLLAPEEGVMARTTKFDRLLVTEHRIFAVGQGGLLYAAERR